MLRICRSPRLDMGLKRVMWIRRYQGQCRALRPLGHQGYRLRSYNKDQPLCSGYTLLLIFLVRPPLSFVRAVPGRLLAVFPELLYPPPPPRVVLSPRRCSSPLLSVLAGCCCLLSPPPTWFRFGVVLLVLPRVCSALPLRASSRCSSAVAAPPPPPLWLVWVLWVFCCSFLRARALICPFCSPFCCSSAFRASCPPPGSGRS